LKCSTIDAFTGSAMGYAPPLHRVSVGSSITRATLQGG
jgi:hypothetical protein